MIFENLPVIKLLYCQSLECVCLGHLCLTTWLASRSNDTFWIFNPISRFTLQLLCGSDDEDKGCLYPGVSTV